MDDADVDRAETELRGRLRSEGLAWLEQQVDEALAQSSEPPDAAGRLATLAAAIAFAFELVASIEAGTNELLLGDGAASDRLPRIEAVEFADPLEREEPRRLTSVDDPERSSAIDALRAASGALIRELGAHEEQ